MITDAISVQRVSRVPQSAPDIGLIERLPKWLLCAPLVAQWVWLGLRYRGFVLPALVNPSILMGGIVGESKQACLDLIAPKFAPFVLPTRKVMPQDDAEAVRLAAGFNYPLIAKPDIGWCGYGVQRIENAAELAAYAKAFPKTGAFLLQRLAPEPCEASIGYLRMPGAARGLIVALTLRHAPHVIGDGIGTIAALIAADVRTARKKDVYAALHSEQDLARIPGVGERVTLTTIASQRVGSRYEDATAQVSGELEQIVDRIARSMGDFHYGRFDVRFSTMAGLRRGEFRILEVNGAGSEAIQYWDPHVPLFSAFAGVFAKQRLLFALGAVMRRDGAKPVTLLALAGAFWHQQTLARAYPPSN